MQEDFSLVFCILHDLHLPNLQTRSSITLNDQFINIWMISLPIVQVRKIELKKSNVPESPKRPVSIVLDSLQVQDGMHSSLSEPSIQVCLLTWNKKIPFFLPLLNFCKMQVTYPKLVRKSWNFFIW